MDDLFLPCEIVMQHAMSAAEPLGQRLAACPRPTPIDRWELLSLVTALRKPLGLADRDVMVLRAHLSVLPHGPLVPGALNTSFMQLSEIQGRACGMDERRFRRGEVQLEARGIIIRRLSANGRRFPERSADGRIIAAYGIDLSPLIERHPELYALQAQLEEEARALRQRRNNLSARLSKLQRGMAPSQRLTELKEAVRNTSRRSTAKANDLDDIEATIAMLESDAGTDTAVADTLASPDGFTGDAGHSVRHIESKPKDINRTTEIMSPTLLTQVWAETTTIREFFPDTPCSEHAIKGKIIEFSSFIGLGQDCINAALALAGTRATIRLVDYIALKISSIAKPRSYLKSMLAALMRGEAVAGGSIYLSR